MREINFEISVTCTEEVADSFCLCYPNMMLHLSKAFEALLGLSLEARSDDLQVTHMEAKLLGSEAKKLMFKSKLSI